jgi:hypothetical protein
MSLVETGMGAGEMRELLQKIRVRLVLTAHPSEAKRRKCSSSCAISPTSWTIARLTQDMLPREDLHLRTIILRRIEQLWQIAHPRLPRYCRRGGAVRHVFHHQVIMDVMVITCMMNCSTAWKNAYPDEDWSELPPVLRFASWIGGDRDGNPNVTPEVTLQTWIRCGRPPGRLSARYCLHARPPDPDPSTKSASEGADAPPGQKPPAVRTLSRASSTAKSWKPCARLENDRYATGDDLLADLRLVRDSLRKPEPAFRAGHIELADAQGGVVRSASGAAGYPRGCAPARRRSGGDALNTTACVTIMKALPETEKQAAAHRRDGQPAPAVPLEPDFSETTNTRHRHLAHGRRRAPEYGTASLTRSSPA